MDQPKTWTLTWKPSHEKPSTALNPLEIESWGSFTTRHCNGKVTCHKVSINRQRYNQREVWRNHLLHPDSPHLCGKLNAEGGSTWKCLNETNPARKECECHFPQSKMVQNGQGEDSRNGVITYVATSSSLRLPRVELSVNPWLACSAPCADPGWMKCKESYWLGWALVHKEAVAGDVKMTRPQEKETSSPQVHGSF